MNDITIQKLTKSQKEQIRWLYLGEYEVTDIATKLNIEPETVRFFIFGPDGNGSEKTCLYQIKKGMSSTAISAFIADKANVLERTGGIALNILNRALAKLDADITTGEVTLNLNDMKTLSSIVLDFDKLVRLETGKATEHIQHIGLTTAEARQLLESDPFAQNIIEAEFTENKETLPWLNQEKE
jgi:hypothetical protein